MTAWIFHCGLLCFIGRGDEADGAFLRFGKGEEFEHPSVIHVARMQAERAPAVKKAPRMFVATENEIRTGLWLTRDGIRAINADVGVPLRLIPIKRLVFAFIAIVFFVIFHVALVVFFIAFISFRAKMLLQAHTIARIFVSRHVCEILWMEVQNCLLYRLCLKIRDSGPTHKPL
jgi:hypothetical protein